MQSNHDFATDGIATIQIIDTGTYNEALTLSGISGTPSATAYLHITSNASDPISGPTWENTSVGNNEVVLISTSYTEISNLTIYLNNSGSSREGIRVSSGMTGVLISRCKIYASGSSSDQDGIYAGAYDVTVYVDHCYITGFGRACLHPQNFNAGATQNWYVDHCSLGSKLFSGEQDGGGLSVYRATNAYYNIYVYNTFAYDIGGSTDSANFNEFFFAGGTINWYGDYNVSNDASAETRWGTTNNWGTVTFTESEPSSGENAWLTEIDSATPSAIDLSVAGENSYTVTQNGTDRSGSEPDARQDFSTDILGTTRSVPTIGAYEFGVASRSITVSQTDGAETQAATLDVIVELTAAQTETGETQAADLDVLVELAAAQTDGAETQAASLQVLATPRNITAAQTDGDEAQAAALQSLIQIAASQTEGDETQAADLDVIVELTAAQTEGAETQAADLDVIVELTASQTEAAETQTADLDVLAQIAASQTDGAETQAADLDAVVSIAAAQTEAGETAPSGATVRDADGTGYAVSTTVLDADGTEYVVDNDVLDADGTGYTIFSSGTIAALQVLVQAAADQTEAGETQTADLDALVELTAAQTETGDSQTASLLVVAAGTRVITASQTDGTETQAADLDVLVSLSAAQTEAGDTVSADLQVLIQLTSSQIEAGDLAAASLHVVGGFAAYRAHQANILIGAGHA